MAEKRAAKKSLETPHPNANGHLVAHGALLREWTEKAAQGALPHSLLLSGPQGIGKATLAYHFLRALLAMRQEGLLALPENASYSAPDHPVARRIIAGSHSDLLVIEADETKKKTASGAILAEDVRKIREFLSMKPAESLWRAVLIDSADAMNLHAANALLKILEEPPANALILLIAHNRGGLMPTILSRCQTFRCKPLTLAEYQEVMRGLLDIPGDEPARLALLSDHSPGTALRLHGAGALELYEGLLHLFSAYPSIPTLSLHKFADGLVGRDDGKWLTFTYLFQYFLSSLIRQGAGRTEAAQGAERKLFEMLLARKPVTFWLRIREEAAQLFEQEENIHLDRKQILLNLFHSLQG